MSVSKRTNMWLQSASLYLAKIKVSKYSYGRDFCLVPSESASGCYKGKIDPKQLKEIHPKQYKGDFWCTKILFMMLNDLLDTCKF